MRPVRFLVPGTTGRFRCGGLLVELQTARLISRIAPVQVVTYRQREAEHPFLADLLRQEPVHRNNPASSAGGEGVERGEGGEGAGAGDPLWIVSWGFDVPKLLRQLRGRAVAYHAHSSGYGFDLPAGVPVLAVSRNTLGYWGDRASRNPLFLLPNALEASWLERGARPGTAAASALGGQRRPIDVLVQQRKNSSYVLERLVPVLRARGLRVEVQSGWVDDLVDLFNSASVVLYDSADYWRGRGVSEGFGLPPLEALACGCVVFSSLNHALADTLDPGRLGHQIGCGCLEADVERISAAVADPAAWRAPAERLESVLAASCETALLARWREALAAIDQHWRLCGSGARPLIAPPLLQLRCGRLRQRLLRLLPRR